MYYTIHVIYVMCIGVDILLYRELYYYHLSRSQAGVRHIKLVCAVYILHINTAYIIYAYTMQYMFTK